MEAAKKAGEAKGTTPALPEIRHTDLRLEAERAVNRGESVTVYSRGSVETVVCSKGRAGQADGGVAVWGDWCADREVIEHCGEEPETDIESDLDGNQINLADVEADSTPTSKGGSR